MIILYIYLVFASLISMLYVYLFIKYYLPIEVRNATRWQKLKTFTLLYVAVFLGAPYALYELIKIQMKGGFKNDSKRMVHKNISKR